MRRPDVFTLDYSHPLAQGLVCAWLGRVVGCSALQDESFGRSTLQISNAQWAGRSLIFGYTGVAGTTPRVNLGTLSQLGTGQEFTYFISGLFISNTAHRNSILLARGAINQSVIDIDRLSPKTLFLRLDNYTSHNHGISYTDYTNASSFCITRSGGNSSVFLDGALKSSIIGGSTGGFAFSSGAAYVGTVPTDGNVFDGEISSFCLYNRALSPAEIAILADRTDLMLGGLIVEERPVLYFDMGGDTTDDLTADNLVVGSPVLGSPALTQAHVLTATNFATGSPALGTPALTQAHALAATALTVSSPVLGTPTIGQVHALTATGLTTSAPVLGEPALVENAADVDALFADALVVGSPVLGTPALTQVHVLGSDGLVTGSPVLGSPTITQIHALTALGLTVGVPVLGTPVINGTILDLGVTADLRSVGLDTVYSTSFGVFSVELSSSSVQRIILRSVGNFEVNELGE